MVKICYEADFLNELRRNTVPIPRDIPKTNPTRKLTTRLANSISKIKLYKIPARPITDKIIPQVKCFFDLFIFPSRIVDKLY